MKTYKEVGESVGLTHHRLKLYIDYMNARWKDSEWEKVRFGYAREWAERFEIGTEWNSSDYEGQQVLMKLNSLG